MSSENKYQDAIFVGEESPYELKHFVIPDHYTDDVDKLLIPHGVVIDRIEKLAREITRNYSDRL
ncbi:hypothetical protein BB560_007218, partial [Smittium megazygosporum]